MIFIPHHFLQALPKKDHFKRRLIDIMPNFYPTRQRDIFFQFIGVLKYPEALTNYFEALQVADRNYRYRPNTRA
jgi:hypothetical protein